MRGAPPRAMLEGRTRVLQASLAAIASAAAVEVALGLSEGSLALLTDGAHAALDGVVTLVLLLAARLALRPPDAGHPYGHGKVESLGGMLGGVAIFGIACYFVYAAVSGIRDGPAAAPGALAIAGGAYAVCADAFRIAILGRAARRTGAATVRADLYHAAAGLGATAVAMAGIALATGGFPHGDLAAALVLGALLMALSAGLVRRTALDLTDSIPPGVVRRAREAAASVEGVVGVGPVMVRRSGETHFADATVSLRGDTSFERAHEASSRVEASIRAALPGSSVTVHFEPDWGSVPPGPRIRAIAEAAEGVRGVHNVSTHEAGGRTYADLHVMVDSGADLRRAHGISEAIEAGIRAELPGVEHATIHLEPFVSVPDRFRLEDEGAEARIRAILERRPEVRGIGRIVSLDYGGALRVDVDCSFDGSMTIERAHGLTSEIEHEIRSGMRDAVITIHPEPA